MKKNDCENVVIKMPRKLHNSLLWLSTQTDSKGNKHSISEIVVGAVHLYLMGIQTLNDSNQAKKKMN